MNLLNCQELAKAFGKPHTFVTAMRRAGYKLEYEALGKTTLEHALARLKLAEDFRAHHYLIAGWERLPKLLAEPKSPAALTAGKSC